MFPITAETADASPDAWKSASLLAPYFQPARHYDLMPRKLHLHQPDIFHLPAISHVPAFFSGVLIFRTCPLLLRARPPLSPARPKQFSSIPTCPPDISHLPAHFSPARLFLTCPPITSHLPATKFPRARHFQPV